MDTIFDLFDRLTGFIDSLTQLVTDSPLTYLVILAFPIVDVLIPVIPAEAAITTAAVLAGQGQLNIVFVMIAAALGAFIGDNIAYWIGRLAGRPVAERLVRDSSRLDGVEEQFDKHGGLLIIVGRFIPWGRTTVTIGAGVLQYPWKRFLLFDLVAVVIYPFPTALPGFVGGVVVQDQPWLALVIGFALSLSVAGVIALVQRWYDGRQRDGEAAADQADERQEEATDAGADPAAHDGGSEGRDDGRARMDAGRPEPWPAEAARSGAPTTPQPLPDETARGQGSGEA